jgi:hypothetical protein
MIPRGPVYRELRAIVMGQFPDGTKASFRDTQTLGEWFSSGSIQVRSCSKQQVVFDAPEVEFGSMLLVEIENLFNHCFEQLQEIGCVGCDLRLRSEAWNVVSAYYFSFYAGGALLRLLGRPVIFMRREQLEALATLAGATVAPAQGTFEIKQVHKLSATHAQYVLKKTDKVHEATWTKLMGTLDELQRRLRPNTDLREAEMYDAMMTKVLFPEYVNYQWPSSVRNRANYRLGFAYKLSQSPGTNFKLIEHWAKVVPTDIHKIVAEARSECMADPEEFANHVRLLIALGTGVFVLARELYSELLQRKSLDKRWEDGRKKYRKKMILPENDFQILAQTF